MSVISKLEASDLALLLDEVQYTKGGFTNRNRLPNGAWLTVPVQRVTDGMPINRVRIAEHGDWRRRISRTLHQHYGHAADPIVQEINRPYRLLIGLNLGILRHLLHGPEWHFQSHLDGGHATVAVSDDERALLPISDRLAMMVEELGGDTYLSGASGFRYLSEAPFLERGIRVRYWTHAGPNPSVLERLRTRTAV